MLEKIKKEEVDFMELWHNPIALIETLFSNFDNLAEFSDEKFGDLRLYQYPMVSFEPLLDKNQPEKTEKEIFQMRKNMGDIYNFGARKFGKTVCTERLDIPVSLIHDAGWQVGLASMDAQHMRDVLDSVKQGLEFHPILKCWKRSIHTAPTYKMLCKNGWFLNSINMNLNGKNPGNQFFGKHVKKLFIEENSFETEEVYKKRVEALSEFGAVMRCSGMTNFTKFSPAGRAFYSQENKSKVLNLPQFVNPFWSEKEKQERIEQYGGQESLNYKIFVLGEVVEDGVSEFDIERVKECYVDNQAIKRFEITKEQAKYFEDLIVVERPKNCGRIFVCSDVGDGAGGTDIVILGEIDEKYKWLYNICLYNLTEPEQEKVFDYLIEKLQANVIAIDCSEACGRGLFGRFEKKYSKDNLVAYWGQKKVAVDFEKSPNGEILMQGGQPVVKEEFMSEWSVRRLKTLLYEKRMIIPYDPKFDNQINSVISTQSGTRKIYACISQTGDHLFDAFKVFALAQWLKKDFNQTKAVNSEWGSGASSW